MSDVASPELLLAFTRLEAKVDIVLVQHGQRLEDHELRLRAVEDRPALTDHEERLRAVEARPVFSPWKLWLAFAGAVTLTSTVVSFIRDLLNN